LVVIKTLYDFLQAYLEMHKLIGDIVDVFEEIKMESSS